MPTTPSDSSPAPAGAAAAAAQLSTPGEAAQKGGRAKRAQQPWQIYATHLICDYIPRDANGLYYMCHDRTDDAAGTRVKDAAHNYVVRHVLIK
ncbi:hypothetical protein OEZ86_012629 [Tetradesmus obliquus]|nr:hypothetical protein OEZ86_012629 [Tetradesmus obliquus]